MKFTVPPNKNFQDDIVILKEAIESGEHITFSKFCDGEWAVLENRHIDNGEFSYDPNNENDKYKREKLLEAFQYNDDRYFIGIACAYIFGIEMHRNMVNLARIPQERLTWADIWVNSNYQYFVDNIIPLFSSRPVLLFCNENGDINNLPFRPYMVFPVKENAWEHNWKHIEIAKTVMEKNHVKDSIALFCCGPFGNILAHELTMYHPENTYLDIGSTLNPYLKSEKFQRDYYTQSNNFHKVIGRWDNETR